MKWERGRQREREKERENSENVRNYHYYHRVQYCDLIKCYVRKHK